MQNLSSIDGDFSLEMGDYVVRKNREFDRMWKVQQGGTIGTSPIFYNELVYFASADHCVYAVNPLDGSLVWKFQTMGVLQECSCVACNGIIYIGSFDMNMYALDAATGDLVWKFKTGDKIASTALVDEGTVYFGGKDRFVYALDAKSGILKWKYETAGAIVSEPTVVGNMLIIGSYDRNLYSIDKETGRMIWKLETQDEVHNVNSIPVKDGILYFSSFDNFVRAVNIEDGRLLWKVSLGLYGLCVAPTLHKDVLYCPSRNGILYAVSLEGKILWKYVTSDNIGVPCIYDDRIYIGSCDMHLHCINLEGRAEWKHDVKSILWWKPAIADDVLVFGTWNCLLYCMNVNTHDVLWKFKVPGSPSPLPPANDVFTFEIDVKEDVAEDVKKVYELDFEEKVETGSFYKSRIVYQFNNQYKAKGQYTDDSEEKWL